MPLNASLQASAERACEAIRGGTLRGPALRSLIATIPFGDRDLWVDTVLGIEAAPDDRDLPRGAVPYLPCSVDEIVTALDAVPVGEDDDFVDLGAGLGRVSILAHLLTGARARGIELQPHLVDLANARAASLDLPVTITAGDVAEAALVGSVFFLYAPFNGTLLARVLTRIRQAARERPLAVCAVALELEAPWLAPRSRPSATVTVYDALPSLR